MWLAGPLRDIGEGDSNGAMTDNAKKVLDLVEVISKKAEVMGFDTSQKQ
jgi:hypothetical protein